MKDHPFWTKCASLSPKRQTFSSPSQTLTRRSLLATLSTAFHCDVQSTRRWPPFSGDGVHSLFTFHYDLLLPPPNSNPFSFYAKAHRSSAQLSSATSPQPHSTSNPLSLSLSLSLSLCARVSVPKSVLKGLVFLSARSRGNGIRGVSACFLDRLSCNCLARQLAYSLAQKDFHSICEVRGLEVIAMSDTSRGRVTITLGRSGQVFVTRNLGHL